MSPLYFLKKPPLVLLTHDSNLDANIRSYQSPEKLIEQGNEFVKLGFAVLIVERRGYGRSTENFVEVTGACEVRNHLSSGINASFDILGAVKYAQENLAVDPNKVLLVGHSAGGFSAIFASGYSLPGIIGAINFSGVRGVQVDKTMCNPEGLLESVSVAGKTSRVPTLWVYVENDTVVPVEFGKSMFKKFSEAGGQGEFIVAPPYDNEGHSLFSKKGIPQWRPIVEKFIQKNQLL